MLAPLLEDAAQLVGAQRFRGLVLRGGSRSVNLTRQAFYDRA